MFPPCICGCSLSPSIDIWYAPVTRTGIFHVVGHSSLSEKALNRHFVSTVEQRWVYFYSRDRLKASALFYQVGSVQTQGYAFERPGGCSRAKPRGPGSNYIKTDIFFKGPPGALKGCADILILDLRKSFIFRSSTLFMTSARCLSCHIARSLLRSEDELFRIRPCWNRASERGGWLATADLRLRIRAHA